jgi:hypothetical protein
MLCAPQTVALHDEIDDGDKYATRAISLGTPRESKRGQVLSPSAVPDILPINMIPFATASQLQNWRNTAPRVRLRVSSRQLQLMLPMLALIVARDKAFVTTGYLAPHLRDRIYQRRVEGAHYTAGMTPFYELLRRLSALSPTGGRVRLHQQELASGMFAVRALRTAIRHGHIAGSPTGEQDIDSLLLKLDRYRRRAKSKFEKRCGADAYHAWQSSWPEVLLFIDKWFLRCNCDDPTGWSNMRRWYRDVVRRATQLAADGLCRRSLIAPESTKLRRLVRRALRAVRRGTTHTVRHILENPKEGGDVLASFIAKNYGADFEKSDLSTLLSHRSELLCAMSGERRSISSL